MTNNIVNPWTPGTTYPPNSVVRPTYVTGSSSNPPTNADFESGGGSLTGWTSSGSFVAVTSGAYSGIACASLPAVSGTQTLINNNHAATPTGVQVGASCYVNFGLVTSLASARVTLTVYDSGGSFIATFKGPQVFPATTAGANGWKRITIAQQAMLIGTAFVAVGVEVINNSAAGPILIDTFSWDLLANPFNANQLFYAVQTGTGKSGQTEPVWATTPPNITDGTVTWSSQVPTSILWVGEPMLKSGSVEPGGFGGPAAWPTQPGLSVLDTLSVNQNLSWVAVTPQVVDPNDSTLPPQSPYVMIASSKIFVANTDIVNFCATTNPLDWTSEGDAGFLPTGLQTYGGNPFQAIGLYRSNGVFFNSQGMQMWQLDEDPANMALLEAIPIGSTRQRALAPVNNDLFFLAAQGVRTMGISAGSGNLQAGDVGMPIDPLVLAAVAYADANSLPCIGSYFPSAGQYWLGIPNFAAAAGTYVSPPTDGVGTTTIFVYTMSRVGEVGAWSRYVIPVVMQDFAQFGDDLYIRALDSHSNQIALKVVPDGVADLQSGATATTFTSIVQWPWLDDGQPGQTKQLGGVDFTVTLGSAGTYTFQVGYDQSDTTAFTTACTLSGDTVPGFMIPIPVMGPSFSLRMTLTSNTSWQVQAAALYLQDQRLTS